MVAKALLGCCLWFLWPRTQCKVSGVTAAFKYGFESPTLSFYVCTEQSSLSKCNAMTDTVETIATSWRLTRLVNSDQSQTRYVRRF